MNKYVWAVSHDGAVSINFSDTLLDIVESVVCVLFSEEAILELSEDTSEIKFSYIDEDDTEEEFHEVIEKNIQDVIEFLDYLAQSRGEEWVYNIKQLN